jgi:NhaP-type Na+/H+ or K+/H+ antiporter
MALNPKARVTLLALLPTSLAAAGAAIDESRSLGVTTWRTACRAAGLSLPSVTAFTWQLLPNMIAGALLGALLLLGAGWLSRHREERVREYTAAHLGCFLAMPLALLACALSLPMALMPLADLMLAAIAAMLLLRALRRDPPAHP